MKAITPKEVRQAVAKDRLNRWVAHSFKRRGYVVLGIEGMGSLKFSRPMLIKTNVSWTNYGANND